MKSILIADDDKFFRDQLSNFFSNEGFSVKTVENGSDAVDEIVREKFNVIILDVYMNKMNGLQVIPIIQKAQPDVPIIVITGDNSLNLEREIRSQKVFYYLIKPFAMKEMREAVYAAVKSNGGM